MITAKMTSRTCRLFVEFAQFVPDHQEKPQNTEVILELVTDEEIARLNEQYRGKEGLH